jgi:DNA invertase Pin-like site-specific DNA recombinase
MKTSASPTSQRGVPALGYVSIPPDKPLDGPDVEQHRRAIDSACADLGLQLVDFVRDHEPDASASNGRPGLLGALDRIDAGDATCLIVNDLQHLGRRVGPLATVLDRLEKQGTRLVALDVRLDTATEAGRLAAARRPKPARPEVAASVEVAPAPAEVEPAPEPVEVEAAPPPAEVEPAPEPVEVEAAPAPVEVEPAPAPVEVEAAPPPVEVEAAPAPPAEAAPPETAPAAPPAPAPPREVPAVRETVRALGYASVPADAESTVELDAQKAAIERWCQNLGIELTEVICEREPRNRKALDRAGLSFLIERIAGGDASCIVVSGLERLSASVAELGTIVRWLERNDVRLLAINIDLDSARPGGRTTLRALASVAGMEHERLSDRTRKGLAAAREKRRAASDSSSPDWAAIRKRIATMRADGMTLQAIADVLNAEGVPTMRGGAQWRKSSVQTAAGYRRRSRSTSAEDLPDVAQRPPG